MIHTKYSTLTSSPEGSIFCWVHQNTGCLWAVVVTWFSSFLGIFTWLICGCKWCATGHTTWKVDGSTPMYWFIISPYKPPLGGCAIYFPDGIHKLASCHNSDSLHIEYQAMDYNLKPNVGKCSIDLQHLWYYIPTWKWGEVTPTGVKLANCMGIRFQTSLKAARLTATTKYISPKKLKHALWQRKCPTWSWSWKRRFQAEVFGCIYTNIEVYLNTYT